MFHTFSYDGRTHTILITGKVWSDFGAHIPLIRSFSYGPNLARLFRGQPIESPLFPGEPVRYHFGFFALVGILEKLGVRIDWAFNIPSAFGFFIMLIGIYLLSYTLFSNYYVSLLSVLFPLFNGSLTFLRFFDKHPFGITTPYDIITNSHFSAFGPWDGNTITAFWTLNIFTNQRHLALSYGLIISILHLLLRSPKLMQTHQWRYTLYIALGASMVLFFNYPATMILGICCITIWLIRKETRIPLSIAGICALPALAYLSHEANISGSDIVWQPGYLVSVLTANNFIRFWIDNLGLHTLLIPLGLFLAPKHARRIFLGPLLALFILPNLFRFSPDMINNHKFFNFFLIIGSMFSAYAVIRILNLFTHIKTYILRTSLQIVVGAGLIGILTFSGMIDLFPIINDTYGSIPDIMVNPDTRFIKEHTNPDDVIANSTWFYHPASIAGRPIFSGYTYFTWSYGYDQVAREQTLRALYEAQNITQICALLRENRIAYVELNKLPESYLHPNYILWNTLSPIYENPNSHLKLYSQASLCE
jgi:hypothetical protein